MSLCGDIPQFSLHVPYIGLEIADIPPPLDIRYYLVLLRNKLTLKPILFLFFNHQCYVKFNPDTFRDELLLLDG